MLQISHLNAAADTFRLRAIDLTVPAGRYAVLLGPPGSGKSVLIETICGLRRATAGRIAVDGVDITGFEPRDRRIGYVPQDYALFGTKRVSANIMFGLRARGVRRSEARAEVQWVIDLLGLHHLLDRWPGTLSGGEQQRVALARALATRPRLLLLDEPVSALDEGSRDRVCRELRRIQRDLGITTLHISHNLEEAFSVADLAAVMHDGRIAQVGSMEDLVRRPVSPFVARFLRSENVFDGKAGDGAVQIGHLRLRTAGKATGRVTVMIRPENIGLRPPGADPDPYATALSVTLDRRVDQGPYVRLDLAGPLPLIAHISHHDAGHLPKPGAPLTALVHPRHVHLMPPEE